MKFSAISIAIVLAGIAGVASAAGQVKVFPQIKVSGAPVVAGCSPSVHPNSQACRALREAILAHYSAWQLSVIYGTTTPHLAYINTGARDRLVSDYGHFLQQYDRDYMATHSKLDVRVAGK
ncbi:MAG: hypothetical protein JSR56_00835 [Proteobacteria bacterium]|nr:hypothetical protein [Pseudomonadota bacterium]